MRFIQRDDESGTKVKEALIEYLRVNDSTGKGLVNVFFKRPKELGSNLPHCDGQCHENGINMERKEAGLQARFLRINSKP